MSTYDVVVLGSGIAGLSAALAAHEAGLKPVLLEKSDLLGGCTTNSYGLVWVGENYLQREAGLKDSRDDILRYMRFLGGGEHNEERLTTFVDRSPAILKRFADWGIRVPPRSRRHRSLFRHGAGARSPKGAHWKSN